jgi:hypothetical protein
MGMLYEYSDEELEAMGYKEPPEEDADGYREGDIDPDEPTIRELQSEVDRSRQNNIVRATETYAQTLARIKTKYKH